MRVTEAQKLKDGDKVFIDYHGNKGHSERIFCAGVVEGSYREAPVSKNAYDVEYIGISVKYQGIRSVFPSFCLSKI